MQDEAGVGADQLAAASWTAPVELHGIRKGHTLSAIAMRVHGDTNAWPRLLDANRVVIEDPDLIQPD